MKYFVVVESVTVKGDKAVVAWGTDLSIPARDGGLTLKVCCSLATDRYSKRDGVWVFTERSHRIAF